MTRAPLLFSVLLHACLIGGAVVGAGERRNAERRLPPTVHITTETPPAQAAAVAIEPPPIAAEASEPDAPSPCEAMPIAELPDFAPPPDAAPVDRARDSRSSPGAAIARLVWRQRREAPTAPATAAVPAQAQVLVPIAGTNAPPDYPPAARRRGQQGVVTVVFACDEDGRVVRAAIARGSGFALLDAAALAAVRGWRFAHGPGAGTQEFVFRLRG